MQKALLKDEKSLIEMLVRSQEIDAGRKSDDSGQVLESAEGRDVAGDYRISCRAPIRKVGAIEAIEMSPSKRLEPDSQRVG